MGARFYSQNTPEGQQQQANAAARGAGSSNAAADDGPAETKISARGMLDEKLAVVLAEIEELSKQIEDGSGSAATKHATKKKMQVKKAEKIRIERQLAAL